MKMFNKMKFIKFVKSLIFIELICVLVMSSNVYARAGGGSSGGSSGGGSSASSSHYYTDSGTNQESTMFSRVLNFIVVIIFLLFAPIILRIKVLIYTIKNKKKLRELSKNKEVWKYKNIQKQVDVAFHKIQKGWSDINLEKCRMYMTENLYNQFKIKLEWITYKNQRNILKAISLMKAEPVVIQDDLDDSKDCVWYYIEGAMIDYIINEQTKELISGSKIMPTAFVEYWKFVRDENDNWIVDEILQKDEFKY